MAQSMYTKKRTQTYLPYYGMPHDNMAKKGPDLPYTYHSPQTSQGPALHTLHKEPGQV